MKATQPVNITARTDVAAITALVTFNETVFTAAGRIEPSQIDFTLHVEGKKPRVFKSASGAVEVLRRISK